MSKAVSLCTVKRLFTSWQRHLRTRIGLKLLDSTLLTARVRSVFTRLQRICDFDEAATRHLTLFNAYKLLEITFHGFKRRVSNRDRWAESCEVMALRSVELRKAQYMREWRQRLAEDVWERRMAQFCLISIKNVVMRRYFEVLKGRYERERAKRAFLRER